MSTSAFQKELSGYSVETGFEEGLQKHSKSARSVLVLKV